MCQNVLKCAKILWTTLLLIQIHLLTFCNSPFSVLHSWKISDTHKKVSWWGNTLLLSFIIQHNSMNPLFPSPTQLNKNAKKSLRTHAIHTRLSSSNPQTVSFLTYSFLCYTNLFPFLDFHCHIFNDTILRFLDSNSNVNTPFVKCLSQMGGMMYR